MGVSLCPTYGSIRVLKGIGGNSILIDMPDENYYEDIMIPIKTIERLLKEKTPHGKCGNCGKKGVDTNESNFVNTFKCKCGNSWSERLKEE